MGSIADVLAERGYGADEEELAAALAEMLPHKRVGVASLSESDGAWLDAFSGVTPATPSQHHQLQMQRAAAVTAEVLQSLTGSEVAALLGVDRTRVSHRSAGGQLFGIKTRPSKTIYPDWQFAGHQTIPHLAELLAALGPGTPPAMLRRFVTTPDPDLVLGDAPVSPRDWLLAGGDQSVVLDLAATLGDIM